jgi:hypothetical protein
MYWYPYRNLPWTVYGTKRLIIGFYETFLDLASISTDSNSSPMVCMRGTGSGKIDKAGWIYNDFRCKRFSTTRISSTGCISRRITTSIDEGFSKVLKFKRIESQHHLLI